MNFRLGPHLIYSLVINIILMASLLTTCSGNQSSSTQPNEDELGKLKVIATTSIISDVVKQVAGNMIDLDVLLPVGVDPHSFEPSPQDIRKLSKADILFINGAGLETFLNSLIENSGGNFRTVDLSAGIKLISLVKDFENEDEYSPGGFDPHVWLDPNNVIAWVHQISGVLSDLDSKNSPVYIGNAQSYIEELKNLGDWIISQVELIPPSQRKLVTDHLVFGYFAKAYGFAQVGALLPSFSNQSQTSAQELAVLEDTIRENGINVILVGISVNPDLARRVAEDTGVELVSVYTDTLTEADGPAANYIDLMRYDVGVIINALR